MFLIRRLLIISFLCLTTFFSQGQNFVTSFAIPEHTHQLIVVTAASWTAKDGRLQRYEKVNNAWIMTGKEVIVALGKNGLAWGKGLHKNLGSPEKKEGDGKAPAGVFTLGTMFGYGDKSPSSSGYAYRQSTARDYWVDDVNSPDYNQWVTLPEDKPNNPGDRWASFERMKRADHLYEFGIVILHNDKPVEKGKGSAIFFHVWRNPGAATLGCTSMSRENLLELMKWLDPKKKPLLIQAPTPEINRLK